MFFSFFRITSSTFSFFVFLSSCIMAPPVMMSIIPVSVYLVGFSPSSGIAIIAAIAGLAATIEALSPAPTLSIPLKYSSRKIAGFRKPARMNGNSCMGFIPCRLIPLTKNIIQNRVALTIMLISAARNDGELAFVFLNFSSPYSTVITCDP